MSCFRDFYIKILSNNYFYQVVLFLLIGLLLKLVYLFASPIWRVDMFFYIQGAKTILDGGVLYKDFGEIKPPGIFFLLSFLMKIFSYGKILYLLKITAIIFQTFTAFFFSKVVERLFSRQYGFSVGLIFLLAISMNFNMWPANVMLLSLLPLSIFIYFISKVNYCEGDIFLAGLFLSLAYLLSSNLIFYSLLFPILIFKKNRIGIKFFKNNLTALVGFLIPILIIVLYFYYNDAIHDWFWWNYHWPMIYGAKPMLPRIARFFQGILFTWQWMPLYVMSIIGFIILLKSQNNNKVLIITIFVISFITRIILGKGVPRYYLYLLPGILLTLPLFFNSNFWIKKKKYMSILFITIILFSFIHTNYSIIVRPINPLSQYQNLTKWIFKNTDSNDKIFVWKEGYSIYFLTQRKMATSFFSTSQHLTNVYIWEQNKYKNVDKPWKKFLYELKRDKPKVIVDLTSNFNYNDESRAIKPLVDYVNIFIDYVKNNYKYIQKIDNAKVWVKN